MRCVRWYLSLAAAIALFSAARPAQAITLSVAVTPNPYTGQCPQDPNRLGVLTFTGKITGGTPNAAAQFQFLVLRGHVQQIWNIPAQPIALDAGGAATAKWTFTPPASGNYAAEINVQSGGSGWLLSPLTDFSATCTLAINPAALVLAPNPAGGSKLEHVTGTVVIEQPPPSYMVMSAPAQPHTQPKTQVQTNLENCNSYFVAVKLGDGSVHTAQTRPSGAVGRCAYDISGPWLKAPYDIMIGFGGEKHGVLLGKHHVGDENEYLRIDFTFHKIDIEHKTNDKSSWSDDWTK